MVFTILLSESTAYEWKGKTGLIKYRIHSSNPDTETDSLALGLITPSSQAVLLRIDSSSSNDYLEVEIVSNQNFPQESVVSSLFSLLWDNIVMACQ